MGERTPDKSCLNYATIGLKPLSHQVAGHMHSKEQNIKDVFLECNDETLLKPIQDPPRGERERKFYEKVFNPDCKDPVVLQLRNILPKYHEKVTLEQVPGVEYLKLEDITCKFCKPCIADIKIGPITYDPEATPEKIAREKAKYPPLEKVGFQLRGMRIYNPDDDSYEMLGKDFLRKLSEDEVLTKGLKKFFSTKSSIHKDRVQLCLNELKKIEKWFDIQTQFSFYASSLLVVYEGARTNANIPTCEKVAKDSGIKRKAYRDIKNSSETSPDSGEWTGKEDEEETPPCKIMKTENKKDITHGKSQSISSHSSSHNCDRNRSEEPALVDIRMIDFAHVFATDKQDENYLMGLRSLIKYMHRLHELD